MPAADWSVAVPTRHVNGDGTVIVVAQATDATSGRTVQATLTITDDFQLTLLASGIGIAGAWSDV